MRLALIVAMALSSLASGQDFKLGSKVTDFELRSLDGKPVKYRELKGEITAVIFTATRCPVSNAYVERMDQLYRQFHPKGVNFIVVNANATESLQEVADHSRRMGFPFPVYKDLENAVADKFGAASTPESYVIDHSGTVRYRGAIDDSQNVARIKVRGLADALSALLRGAEVPKAETKAFGCTLKRVRKAS